MLGNAVYKLPNIWGINDGLEPRQGLLALVGGRFDEAVGLLSRSLDIQVMPETYLALGMACERQGDRGRALQVYEALVQITPDSSYRRTATDRINSLRLP